MIIFNFLNIDFTIRIALDLIIIGCLIAIVLIDAKHLIIPDRLTFLIAILAGLQIIGAEEFIVIDHIIGAVLAFALFDGTRRSMTYLLQREAMGFGDVKLISAGGLWVGAHVLPYAIVIACIGAMIFILLRYGFEKRSSMRQRLPFGPFIALGLVAARIYELHPNLLNVLF